MIEILRKRLTESLQMQGVSTGLMPAAILCGAEMIARAIHHERALLRKQPEPVRPAPTREPAAARDHAAKLAWDGDSSMEKLDFCAWVAGKGGVFAAVGAGEMVSQVASLPFTGFSAVYVDGERLALPTLRGAVVLLGREVIGPAVIAVLPPGGVEP